MVDATGTVRSRNVRTAIVASVGAARISWGRQASSGKGVQQVGAHVVTRAKEGYVPPTKVSKRRSFHVRLISGRSKNVYPSSALVNCHRPKHPFRVDRLRPLLFVHIFVSLFWSS